MVEIIKETITTQQQSAPAAPVVMNAPMAHQATDSQRTEYLIYFFFGILEVLLAFRLVLKLLGASTASAFVRMIYSLSGIFIWPFEGIFRRGFTEGIETTSVFEPSTMVALIVYIFIAWGVVKLVRVLSGEQEAV